MSHPTIVLTELSNEVMHFSLWPKTAQASKIATTRHSIQMVTALLRVMSAGLQRIQSDQHDKLNSHTSQPHRQIEIIVYRKLNKVQARVAHQQMQTMRKLFLSLLMGVAWVLMTAVAQEESPRLRLAAKVHPKANAGVLAGRGRAKITVMVESKECVEDLAFEDGAAGWPERGKDGSPPIPQDQDAAGSGAECRRDDGHLLAGR